jgi:hypothetical protein
MRFFGAKHSVAIAVLLRCISLGAVFGLLPSAAVAEPAEIAPLPNVDGVRFRALTYDRANTLDSPALEAALRRELAGRVAGVRYLYNQIDLNGDGRSEVVAYLVGPSVCGSGGCTLMVFQPTGQGTYRLISRHTLVNNPIVVSDVKTKGWRDLVLYVAGGGAQPNYHVLRFDGKAYPPNPSTAPTVRRGVIVTGNAVVSDRLQPGGGFVIKPAISP